MDLALAVLWDTRRFHATSETLLVEQKTHQVARRTVILHTEQAATVTAEPGLGEFQAQVGRGSTAIR